jgi:acetyl esterase/lipase
LFGRPRYPSPYRELAERGRLPIEHLDYGPDRDQRVELRRPLADTARGAALLIHGGFWREVWRSDLMNALAIDLATRGWAAWNLEYRRVRRRGDAWPVLLEDVAAGAQAASEDETFGGLPLLIIGHSAGGQLALWLAAKLNAAQRPAAGVVGLAPISDMRAGAAFHLGGDAVVDLIGGLPGELPDRYEAADPKGLLPLGTPTLLVHGSADEAVPVAMSRDFARTATDAGDSAELIELTGTGHSALVDPSQEFWERIRAWMDARSTVRR